MADGTQIEWTDATWNPITGCSVKSPGCINCYAMKLAGSTRPIASHPSRVGLTVPTKAGPVWTGEVRFNEAWLTQPLHWRKPRKIFVCAHGDLFHENVPDEWIDKIFAVMALAPQHQFQVLTKRSARMRDYTTQALGRIADRVMSLRGELGIKSAVAPLPHVLPGAAWWPLANVWLGVSVEDQARADERIPDLLATAAAVRWLSCEPLLGPVDLGRLQEGLPANAWLTWLDALDWIVAGGESGQGARPMYPDWARTLRDQCAATDVPFLFKQWGEHFPSELRPDCGDNTPWRTMPDGVAAWLLQESGIDRAELDPVVMLKPGKKRAGRLLDGVEHNGFPA